MAEGQNCADYDEGTFRATLRDIRALSREEPATFLPRMTELCNLAGVAFVVVRPLPKTALSGVARWLTPRRALIQQSLRHKSDDHFWFTFFHEAAHLLQHSKRAIYVDDDGADPNSEEHEANQWAREHLIAKTSFAQFANEMNFSERTIRKFAETQGISAGIVVGMLQHDNAIPWRTPLNRLKCRFNWADDPASGVETIVT